MNNTIYESIIDAMELIYTTPFLKHTQKESALLYGVQTVFGELASNKHISNEELNKLYKILEEYIKNI